MLFIYNFLLFVSQIILKIAAPFHKKTGLFVAGRANVFADLQQALDPKDHVVWFHCASLGEFEQGRPLIEAVRKDQPTYKVVLTFFSPSGYEVRKDYPHADVVCYLPLDTQANVRRFLDLVHPTLAVFVKYEFWPNMLLALKKRKTTTLLVSGIFRKEHYFFKRFGKGMRNLLQSFTHFFVQDSNSLQLLRGIGLTNATHSGDTRFDRVYDILNQDNSLPYVTAFKEDCYTLVAGSTWKEDEDLLVEYINQTATAQEKFIIAPHNIKEEDILALKASIAKKTVLYSEKEGISLKDCQVFIIDTVGILTKIYSVADVAYVGGGFTKSGVHNILEPSVFGIPVVIGPNFVKFKEATDLIARDACSTVGTSECFSRVLLDFKNDADLRREKGEKAFHYINESKGASQKILAYMSSVLK